MLHLRRFLLALTAICGFIITSSLHASAMPASGLHFATAELQSAASGQIRAKIEKTYYRYYHRHYYHPRRSYYQHYYHTY